MENTTTVIIFLAFLAILQPFVFLIFGANVDYLVVILILLLSYLLYIEVKRIEKPSVIPGNDPDPKEEKKKVEFVSLAVHQLKAPLSTMKMSLMMFIDDEFGKVNDEQRDILKKIYKKNEAMISLVDSLLNVAKLEASKNIQERNSIYIEDIIQSVISNCQEEMKMKGVNFEFEKPQENLPKITADDKRIKLVFQNLFDNAIKYTPAGGKIKAVLSQKGEEIEFQIQDSGIGIPENQKEKMFNEFFRGRNAARTGVEGSGLGLFIAKSIVEAHGGKIWFESEENKGTTFHVSLPIG